MGKDIMKIINRVFLTGASLFVSLNLLQAQTQFTGQALQAGGEVSAQPDSIVQLTAEAQGLNLISPTDLPDGGTFWTLMPDGLTAPFPCAPSDPNVPVYQIADGQFIVDATGGQVTLDAEQTNRSTVTAALETLAQTVVNLINDVQEAQLTQAVMAVFGLDEEETSSRMSAPMMMVSQPDALWLEITNVANGNSYYNLHNATNFVYAILTKTNLLDASWNIEAELWPTTNQTSVLPFTLANYERDILFVRAMDWTGVDSNGDSVPDWWIWKYFGTLDLNATNLDGDGNSLLADYTNNVVPNAYSFTGISVTNNYISTLTPSVQLAVTGYPYYVAVLVDDTNLNNVAWNTYSSSTVTVNLGLTEGWHGVWIGLRGYADDATNAVWQWQRLKLDYTPPALTITSPTNGTVNVPMIQLMGYSPEVLSSISYDLTNAVGWVTNQQVCITGQTYNTNTMEYVTNYFQGYDIMLTNGVNTLTLHATDRAGNMASRVTNIVCVAVTNTPTVALLWPHDGMQISGTDLTIQGKVSDPTATVVLCCMDADGNTNYLNGRTGRDGIFWIENVPLDVTNHFTLTATDVVGVTTTNFSLIQNSAGLSVNDVAAGDTMVSGTVPDGFVVWVNGTQATNNGDGTWTAIITPLCVGGGMVAVAAIPNADNGGNGSGGAAGVNPSSAQSLNSHATVQPPQGVFISSYHNHNDCNKYVYGGDDEISKIITDWQDGQGGHYESSYYNNSIESHPDWDNADWPATSWPQALPAGSGTLVRSNSTSHWSYTGHYDANLSLEQEHCDINVAYQEDRRTADTEIKLATGGPLGSRQPHLWVISASATSLNPPIWFSGDASQFIYSAANTPVAPQDITIMGQPLDTNGNLYVLLPDNDPDIITPTVLGMAFFRWPTPIATKYTPAITVNNAVTLDPDSVTNGADYCVGESLQFDVTGLPSPVYDLTAIWTLPGTFVNTNSDPNCDLFYEKNTAFLQPPQGTSSTHCWYVKDGLPLTASVHVYYRCTQNGKLFDETITGKFNVHRPTTALASPYQPDGAPTARILNGTLSLGVSGITNDMNFSHTITTDGFTSGQVGYFQLVSGSYTRSSDGKTVNVGGTHPDTELDNNAPTRGPFSISANTSNTVIFQDAPADGLDMNNNAKEDLEFSNYLMFKPDGGIWVPLRLITWELHDESLNLTVQGGATTPIDSPSTAFPDWKNTFHN